MTKANKSLKTYLSPSMWFSLRYPEVWKFEEDGTVTSFYKKDGVGALQISAYQTGDHQSAEKNLVEYLEDEEVDEPATISTFTARQNEFAYCSYIHGKDFFQVWFITKGRVLVLATYSRASKSECAEDRETRNMIETLDILGK